MSDPQDIFSDPANRCPGCGADRSRLPAAAHFCPSCGRELVARLTDGLDKEAESDDAVAISLLAAAWQRVCRLHAGAGEKETRENGAMEPRSPILRGYAKALFRLGWHYENARGVQRNNAEALRCYDKAARLGNTLAQSRLGKPSATTSGPVDSDPGPQDRA